MKVINIIEEGRVGGPQLRILQVTNHLKEYGIYTTVVFPKNNSDDFQIRLSESSISFITTPLTTLRKNFKSILIYTFKFFPELFLLFKLFRKLKPNLVHISGGSWQIKGLLAGRLAGLKVIWHLNDTKAPKSLKFIFGMLQTQAHAFITAGHKVQEYYLANENIRPIFNISAPVDCTVFNPCLIKKTHSDNIKRIITVSNINPIKGLEMFLMAAEILNHKSTQFLEFRIVGPVYDSQKKYLKKLKTIKNKLNLNNVIFVGGVQDIRFEMANSDIYVCTSIAEASPTSVWEAMAMAKPIVTTNVGEVSKIINNGISGHIVECGDFKALAEKVLMYLENPHVAKASGVKARKTAIKLLDSKLIALQHKNAYLELLT